MERRFILFHQDTLMLVLFFLEDWYFTDYIIFSLRTESLLFCP